MVTKCGYCGNERKRKGVEIKGAKIKDAKSAKRAAPKLELGREQPEKDEFCNSNFISLAPYGNKKTQNSNGGLSAKSKRANAPQPAAAREGFSFKNKRSAEAKLMLPGGKKKKAKKPPASKGLMDFLSSLND